MSKTKVKTVANGLGELTQEQIIALLGDKYQIVPKPNKDGLTITVGEFKGKPTISILKGEASFINRPTTMGLAKCKLILESLEAIKAFVKDNA